MPALKRPAAAATNANKKPRVSSPKAPSVHKPKQVIDPKVAKQQTILDVLQESELPDGVKDMFQVMLPFAFQQPRHHYQDELLGMVSSQLKSMESDLITARDEKQQLVSSSTDERTALETEIAATTASLEAASSELSSELEKKQNTEHSLGESNSAFSDTERKHSEVVVRVGAAAGTKMELELAISLKAELDLPEAPDRLTKLGSFKTKIESLIQDSNLSNAVLLSLAKEPATRGTFDLMVLQQLDSELSRLLERVEGDITTGDDEQVKSQEALTAAESALEDAKTVHQDAANAHKEALGCKKNADAALAAATKKLRDFDKTVKQWTAGLAAADDSLKEFQSGPLVGFEELSSDKIAEEEIPKSEAGEESAEAAEDDSAAATTETAGQENLSTGAPKADENENENKNAVPMSVDCPVAGDKIVSVEPTNSALSPQAGA